MHIISYLYSCGYKCTAFILLAGLTSLKGILAEILAADLYCKENNYMHALGYLVNIIFHTYSYIAYTSAQLHA